MSSNKSASSKTSKSDISPLEIIISSIFLIIFSSMLPGVIEKSHALDLWQYSHYVNTVSSVIIFTVLMMTPRALRKDSQEARYGQLTAIGFLTIAIQSYHCASALEAESIFLPQSGIIGTIVALVYTLSFYTVTYPARTSPTINGAEKFFSSLAVVTSAGMVPALVLEFIREPIERIILNGPMEY